MNIKYSIISRGTEKYIGKGYMAITEAKDNNRFICNQDHGELQAVIDEESLKFPDLYSIQNIAISRFELVSRLAFDRISFNDNILICGLGSIGFSCLLALLKKGYHKISIYSRSNFGNLNHLENIFKTKLNIVSSISNDYNTYIETTGSSKVLKDIFEQITFNKSVIILSTIRDDDFLINPIIINRKSLSIYGGHEILGVDIKHRNKVFNEILNENLNYESVFNNFVSLNVYSDKYLNNIKLKKSNYIDVMKY